MRTLLCLALVAALAGCDSSKITNTVPPTSPPNPNPKVPTAPPDDGKPPVTAAKTPGGDLIVAINDNALEIKGQKVTDETSLADLEKIFGKPSKVNLEGINGSAVWDNHGVYAIIGKDDKRLLEITFYLGAKPRGYRSDHPLARFAGRLTIDGSAVTKDSDVPALAKAKKRPLQQLEEGSEKAHSWEIRRKARGPHVGIETDDDKGKGVRTVTFTI